MQEIQMKIESLKKLFSDSRKTLILTHDNPDPDSIASSLGWQYLLRSRFGQESTIAYGGIVGRAENQSMIRHLNISMTHVDQVRFDEYSLVALMDTQPMSGNNSLPDSVEADIVIDHHPLQEETRKVSFYDVREEVGATSSIVTSFLRETDTLIQPRLATALYYGIKSDTQDLGRGANALDADHYLFLFPIVQRELLNRIVYPKVSAEYFKVLNRAFNKARIQGSSLVTFIGKSKIPDMVAEVADMLLRHEGVEWVLAMGTFRKTIVFSIRTSEISGGAGILAQSIVRGIGYAGGHGMIAGGRVELKGRPIRELGEVIQERFLKEVGTVNQPVEALV